MVVYHYEDKKQKGIPGLSADSWSHRAAVDGQALFLYLTVK